MSSYPQRVAENILPLSLAGTLPDAFQEWYFTENVEDHLIADADCELCDKEQLRYHFEIQNRTTEHCLWVGSSCILKFKVQVFDDGMLLDAKASKRKLEDIKSKMRLDACISALEKLAREEGGDILSGALKYYRKNKYLTPKQAFVVLWRLNENKIDHSPSFFKINLNNHRCQTDLKNMSARNVRVIWAALSASQRKMAIRLGHRAPK